MFRLSTIRVFDIRLVSIQRSPPSSTSPSSWASIDAVGVSIIRHIAAARLYARLSNMIFLRTATRSVSSFERRNRREFEEIKGAQAADRELNAGRFFFNIC
jgi:hypothetical protein